MRPLLCLGLLGTTTIHALMAPPRHPLSPQSGPRPARTNDPGAPDRPHAKHGPRHNWHAGGPKQLTPTGLVHAWALGVILWSSFVGWRGYSLCVLYLVVGSAATKIKQKQKEAQGIAEGRGGARGPENVWGSAATAACVCLYTASASRP